MLGQLRARYPARSLTAQLEAQQPQPEEVIASLDTSVCDWAGHNATRTALAAPVVEPEIHQLLTAAERAGTARGRQLGLWMAVPTVTVLLLLTIALA